MLAKSPGAHPGLFIFQKIPTGKGKREMVKVTVINFGSAARGLYNAERQHVLIKPGERQEIEISETVRTLFFEAARKYDTLLAFGEDQTLRPDAQMFCDFLAMHDDLSYDTMLRTFKQIAGSNVLTMRPTRPAMVAKIVELAKLRFAPLAAHDPSRATDAAKRVDVREEQKPGMPAQPQPTSAPRGRPRKDQKPQKPAAKKPAAKKPEPKKPEPKPSKGGRLRFEG